MPLPAGTSARDVTATISKACELRVAARANDIVVGELHAAIAGSVWSVESGTLSFELEKVRPVFWPCVLKGHPEVDVKEIIAREKLEKEPAFKPDPEAEQMPRRVTDADALRQVKAEFPHLDVDLGPDPHVARHRNHSGPRKTFEWGALPPDDQPPKAAAVTPPPPVAPTATCAECRHPSLPDKQPLASPQVLDSTPTVSPSATASAPVPGSFSWGALPADAVSQQLPAPAPAPAMPAGSFSWGVLPADAVSPQLQMGKAPAAPTLARDTPKRVQPPPPKPIPTQDQSADAELAQQPPAPSGEKYSWGVLPIS